MLALHPSSAEKIGTGVLRFEVQDNGGTLGFWIIRIDGTKTDFSFMQCLRPASPIEQVRAAMRHAVIGQVQAARDSWFGTKPMQTCPILNIEITATTAHMDHESPTFIELADAFTAEHGGYAAIETVGPSGEIGRRFVDPVIVAAWATYHAANAKLRPVSRRANLSDLRRGVRRT